MMISDEFNQHVHGNYTRKISLSSNIKVMNKDETVENIVHKKLLESISKDVSKSECKIVHETSSQRFRGRTREFHCKIKRQ